MDRRKINWITWSFVGLTVLVNPPLREALWRWLRQLWG